MAERCGAIGPNSIRCEKPVDHSGMHVGAIAHGGIWGWGWPCGNEPIRVDECAWNRAVKKEANHD